MTNLRLGQQRSLAIGHVVEAKDEQVKQVAAQDVAGLGSEPDRMWARTWERTEATRDNLLLFNVLR